MPRAVLAGGAHAASTGAVVPDTAALNVTSTAARAPTPSLTAPTVTSPLNPTPTPAPAPVLTAPAATAPPSVPTIVTPAPPTAVDAVSSVATWTAAVGLSTGTRPYIRVVARSSRAANRQSVQVGR